MAIKSQGKDQNQKQETVMKVFLLILASLGLIAQEATPTKGYYCSMGMPMLSNIQKMTKAAHEAAFSDCQKQYKEEQQEQKRRDKEFDKAIKEIAKAEALLKEVQQTDRKNNGFLCRIRVYKSERGKPACADIPPDLENLKIFHAACKSMKDCDKLIPLAAGKQYPKSVFEK